MGSLANCARLWGGRRRGDGVGREPGLSVVEPCLDELDLPVANDVDDAIRSRQTARPRIEPFQRLGLTRSGEGRATHSSISLSSRFATRGSVETQNSRSSRNWSCKSASRFLEAAGALAPWSFLPSALAKTVLRAEIADRNSGTRALTGALERRTEPGRIRRRAEKIRLVVARARFPRDAEPPPPQRPPQRLEGHGISRKTEWRRRPKPAPSQSRASHTACQAP